VVENKVVVWSLEWVYSYDTVQMLLSFCVEVVVGAESWLNFMP
jgi:hypothetical protein